MGLERKQEIHDGAATPEPKTASCPKMRRIGIFVERHWHYGRSICEGVAAFASAQDDWRFDFPDWEVLKSPSALRKYDGLIVRVFGKDMADALALADCPVVDVFGAGFNPAFAIVDQDSVGIGRMAARYFIEHRFANFGFLGYALHHYSVRRRDAFVAELRANGFECSVFENRTTTTQSLGGHVLKTGHFDFRMNRRSVANWIRSLPKPCAVFCSHDIVAWNLAKICASVEARVPEDISILGVGDDPLLCKFNTPSISSIDSDAFGIGRAAARSLAEFMVNPGRRPKDCYPPPIGVSERDSTRIFPISPQWLSDALVFIRRSIGRNITAADVFKHIGMSHTPVERMFVAKLGHSVQSEIASVRIETAKRLIANTSLPLAEVARQSGFAAKSYFTAKFKSATGKTPGEWRSSHALSLCK